MNRNELAEAFQRDGFVIQRQLFSLVEVKEIETHLQQCLDRLPADVEPGKVYFDESTPKNVKAYHRLHEDSAFFQDLMVEPRIMNILQAIWPGDDIITRGVSLFDKPSANSGDTPPHQDNTFQCWNPALALTVTVAIDETTPENAPLICQAGSHHLGMLAHRFSGTMGFSRVLVDPVDSETYPTVELCMKPGDVALHHILTVHSAKVNRSGRPRRQIGIGYLSSRVRRDEAAYAQYQKDLAELHAQNK